MTRRLIWHFADSPVAGLLGCLPAGLEAQPLPAHGGPAQIDAEGALLIDVAGGDHPSAAAVAARHLDVPIVALLDPGAAAAPPSGCHTYLVKPVPPFVLANALSNACDHARLAREHRQTRRQLEELNAIGVRLTAERDTDGLLELILTKAREITRSDAGSIYLAEEPEGLPPRLRFKLAQNDSVRIPFVEFTLPIREDSIAGYVALTGEAVLVDDAYRVPEGYRFRINRDFDTQAGYRTKSMLVVAMRTPAGQVIGVLQLINRRRERAQRFDSAEAVERDALPYTDASRDLAASLASQAAVALENSRLYHSIRTLFEGFVQASVTAIESRDPTTSGHSFRVADLTVALATAADRADHAPLRDVRFSADEMREIRYASLLHDFGKVGVREEVLVKAKKLRPGHLELIRQRGEIIKRGLELRSARRKVDHLLARGREQFVETAAAWDAELECQLAEIDRQIELVAVANEPMVLPDDCDESVQQLALRRFPDHLGEPRSLITSEEARILSIPRGSLTAEEFEQIQSHVVHTYQFLRQIPWTRELRRIPDIARSHHEKLDGSGYPLGRQASEIPLQTRMMTISDIFDALTASDRPYKAAVPVEIALDILGHEAKRGAIDLVLLDLFVATRPWQRQKS
jgi:HD-GYP domain-containing protein (c-di-GMP phosphodiesterase class II)